MNHDGSVVSMTSPSLLLRVARHDADAWRRMSRLYGPLVYQWARRCGLKEDDAADVVQDVFVALAQRIGEFRRRDAADSFRGWLWTITRNKARDHFRRTRDRAAADGGTDAYHRLQQLADDAPEPWAGDDERSASERGVVHRALELIRNEFENSTWQAFWAAAVENKTAAEIAATLGLTKHAVHQAKYRVLRRLREEMEGLG